jgi:hypothetical protein
VSLVLTGWPVFVAVLAIGLSGVLCSAAVVLSVYKRSTTRRRN